MFIEHFADGSADSPLVLLHGFDPKAAALLRERVSALAAGTSERVVVHELACFVSVANCRLVLAVADRDRGIHPLAEPQSFECALRPVRWSNVEGLLEPFAEAASSFDGFQWLDATGPMRWIISTHRRW